MILVTGGTGYIGAHTVVELLQKNYEVVIADNLCNSQADVVDAIREITGKTAHFEKAELCNESEVKALFKQYPIKAIIHFASYKAVGESVQNPLKYYKNNIPSLTFLLEAAVENNIKHFVFSSSCSVYGDADQQPVTEATPQKEATSPYGHTKQTGEKMIDNVVNISDLQAISLRYFNPVGAHETALIGELPFNTPVNLVPVITQTVIGIRKELKIFGSDYPTPDGTCVRDYIHVVDVAEAHVKALEYITAGRAITKHDKFNLGTGKGTSVLELIKAFEAATGEKVNYSFAPRRVGDVAQVYAGTELANEKLGWKATSDIQKMMQSAWKWEKRINNKN